ncbi:OmpA family protein [Clostridium sp. DJ247]|uniref:OmpA/MotB family protein n=1 Tax=Clostridium sp. DJ247 TaxID=2726188 RepID=UPI00162996EF|nr:OmpA family protein [Clostridium sp. DJ247]MBC2578865.1 OmpA family protein [Clostridium sp. DJ247]
MSEGFNTDDDDESGGNEWLATYGDLVTLLLCFFVLLFAMSNIDNIKFQTAISSFTGMSTLSTYTGDSLVKLNPNSTIIQNKDREDEIDKLYKEVRELLDSENLSKKTELKKDENGILLIFKDEMLFDKGKADLKSEVKNILSDFGKLLKKYDKKVRIEGHTDNVPIKNSEFSSNWELSTTRAINVVKYFTEEVPSNELIDPKKFEVAGLAEYDPVAPNDTDVNRQKNRRIEIIILK